MCGEDPEEVVGRLKCCEPPLKEKGFYRYSVFLTKVQFMLDMLLLSISDLFIVEDKSDNVLGRN